MASAAHTCDAIVVGAGYVGCAVAAALAKAGLRVALLDRGPIPSGASRANYGNVQVQDAELAHSLPMVTAGYRRFATLEEELGCSVGYRRVGSLLLIETETQWQIMAARLPALHAAGIRAELVPAERLAELEPLLDRRVVLGACYHAGEGQVSPFRFMAAFLRQGRRHGLALHPHTEVTGFAIAGGRLTGLRAGDARFSAGITILTTGAWTPSLGRLLGRSWAIPHVHGQAMVTERTDLRLNNHLSSAAFFEAMHEGAGDAPPRAVLAVAQTADGHFLLGEAGVITDDLGAQATLCGQAAIAREVGRFLPALASVRVLRGWAAPVAFTDDGLPFLGPVADLPGLILATAFKSTVVVTPLVGDAIAQLVSTGQSDLDLTPFSPDREIAHVPHLQSACEVPGT
jgi:glycine/D-amino acid oxidase-like deaminating enzyme